MILQGNTTGYWIVSFASASPSIDHCVDCVQGTVDFFSPHRNFRHYVFFIAYTRLKYCNDILS